MKIKIYLLLSISILFASCGNNEHFIKDAEYKQTVESDFNTKVAQMQNGDFFEFVDDNNLSQYEKEALKFLYAYMPIGDVTDYSTDYYLSNIRLSKEAREEMPWGNKIPEDIYRHFVLPIRINNENLDEARSVFYAELKDRVKDLSMEDAILEVNHWCHEKVVYRPSDSRTSSPLASVKTAYGRCGEESTFTVAELRAVGIPARQVYTPRWAHTDDNHAWVEAWADGKWYFLGACEPEPVLNLGWFNAPASRGMLMHTKVFGKYRGVEDIMFETPNYTEINLIENYAPTAKALIKVVDANGNPVENAKVEFRVYNYAEFYPMAAKYTDASGQTSLTAGLGDLLIWASKDNLYNFGKFSFGKDNELILVLDKNPGTIESIAFDIVPPVEGTNVPPVTDEQRELNSCRLAAEDSIRNAYVATFITEQQCGALARELQLDSAKITPLIIASRGNYDTLVTFLKEVSAAEKKNTQAQNNALALLEKISAKDLRDINIDVLRDHYLAERQENCGTYFDSSILNPRVANEMLTPYRAFFQSAISNDDMIAYRANPQNLVTWCTNNIAINNELNSQRIPISPVGVWNSRVADKRSRDIFFVSLARSLGIPAWIDAVTGKVQYVDFAKNKDGQVVDVDFETATDAIAPSGILRATYQPSANLKNPKCYSHFTLSKYKDGSFQLLNYDYDNTTWENLLKNGTRLDEGYYLLTSGTRLANGSVLTNLSFFNVAADGTNNIAMTVREDKEQVQVIGNFNSESTYRLADSENVESILQTCGRGYFIVGILGVNQEPTKHALKDIAALGKDFEQWGRGMVLLFPTEEQYSKYHPNEFPGLPSTITYGIDENNAILNEIVSSMKLPVSYSLPVFIIADTFNRVLFVSQGYTIGLGEQLMNVINGL